MPQPAAAATDEKPPHKTRARKPKPPPELAEEVARLIGLSLDEEVVLEQASVIANQAAEAARSVFASANLGKAVAAAIVRRANLLAERATGEKA